jgi:hypothetical protein
MADPLQQDQPRNEKRVCFACIRYRIEGILCSEVARSSGSDPERGFTANTVTGDRGKVSRVERTPC